MKITSYRCPECNAPIQTKDLSDIVLCEHCGAQPFIDWSDNDEENELGEDYTPINNNYNYADSMQSSSSKKVGLYLIILQLLVFFSLGLLIFNIYH